MKENRQIDYPNTRGRVRDYDLSNRYGERYALRAQANSGTVSTTPMANPEEPFTDVASTLEILTNSISLATPNIALPTNII